MNKRIPKSVAVFMAITMIVMQGGFAHADVPECQFTSQPTDAMLAKCQAAQAAAAASAAGAMGGAVAAPVGTTVPPETLGSYPNGSIPTNTAPTGFSGEIPAGVPTGFDASKMDFSKYGAVPQGVSGGAMPEFMGVPVGGAGADPGIGKLANALEQIKQGLSQAEEGITEMKDGMITVDPAMEKSVKAARPIYDAAVHLFEAKDYAGAGTKLQELQAVGFDQKYAAFADSQGISLDLIKDIRGKLTSALNSALKNAPADEVMQIQGDILTQQKFLDDAEGLVKAGKKKEAAALLKKMRKDYGDGTAQADLVSGKSIPTSKISTILDQISAGIDRAGSGLEKAKSAGTDIPQNILDLDGKLKTLYTTAKKAFDDGDNVTATQKIQEIRNLNPEQTFLAFRDQAYPTARLQEILQQGKDGAKALHLSIGRALEYGVNTTDLEALAVQLDGLVNKAEVALNAGDTDTFLTYMSQAKSLNTREKVDAAIRSVAMKTRGELLAQGLGAVRAAIASLESAIPELSKRGGNVGGAKDLLAQANQKLKESQALYDGGDPFKGGYVLDDAVLALSKLVNVLKDSGVKITNDQNNAVLKIVQMANNSTDLPNLSTDSAAKTKGIVNSNENGFDINATLGSLSPDLMDKVLAYRTSDKKLIDGIINDIVPLVPEEDRTAILEGKIGLLDESKNADKSIATMKSLKGVNKDTIQTMQTLSGQIKNYTFAADIAPGLEQKLADFNDKVQSGELKDQQAVNGYVQALKDQVSKSIGSSNTEKFKDKLIPAKNIDDNNPLFQEMQYLRQGGAVTPDKNGNINLDQKIDKNALASLINKTIDKNSVTGGKGTVTIQDATKVIMGAYKVKPSVDLNNAAKTTQYLGQIGAEVSASNFKKQATMKDVAEILVAADQRWGTQN